MRCLTVLEIGPLSSLLLTNLAIGIACWESSALSNIECASALTSYHALLSSRFYTIVGQLNPETNKRYDIVRV